MTAAEAPCDCGPGRPLLADHLPDCRSITGVCRHVPRVEPDRWGRITCIRCFAVLDDARPHGCTCNAGDLPLFDHTPTCHRRQAAP